MLKRLLGLLLAMLMIFALIPVAVFAEETDALTDAAGEGLALADNLALAEEEPPVVTETEQPAAGEGELEIADAEESESTEEPLALFTEMTLALPAGEELVPYTDEPVPGDVNKMPSGLQIEVLASKDTPAAGDTVTYTVNPVGVTPSGNSRPLEGHGFSYRYYYSVVQFVDNNWEIIIDPTSQSYQESNQFEFTFSSSNPYRLRFYVLERYPVPGSDGKQFFSQSEKTDISVTPTGEGKTVEQAADDVVAQCRQELPNGTQYDLALWLHDWIIDHCTYDNNASGVYCSAEGVFSHGKGTCAAYRSAYKMLLDRVGIENARCTGNGHEWNAVKLDGAWYQVDATWDDVDYGGPESYYRHLYFGLNDALMRSVHSDHSPDPARPSDSLEQNYFIKTGQIHTWSDGFAADVLAQLKAGNVNFSLPVNSSEADGTKNVLYGLAAYELSTREWVLDNGKEYSLRGEYKNNALFFTAQDLSEPVTPPEEQSYPLDKIAALHSGKTLTLGIDGTDYYPDASGSFGSIELKGGKKLITVSEYNLPFGSDVHSMYPTGMYVYSLEKSGGQYSLNRISNLDNLLSYGGSSIRITGNKGIRMITGIDQSVKSALTGSGVSGYKLEEYGTLLCWASEIQNGSLSLSDSYARHNYAYSRTAGTDPVFRFSDGRVQYTNVLVGFTNDQCVDDIAMRSYIKLTGPDGEQVTLYGGIVRRSIGYIAYQNRGAFAPGTGAYEYIWDIIHYVYGDQYDADYRR